MIAIPIPVDINPHHSEPSPQWINSLIPQYKNAPAIIKAQIENLSEY